MPPQMSRSRAPIGAVLLGAALAQASCSTRQKWEGGVSVARPEVIAQEFSPLLAPDTLQVQTPDIPMPRGLRPCCAFGSGLQVELGFVPVPMLSLTNVVGVEDLGPHQYDHGIISLEQSRPGGDVMTSERNGLVYTCRGGFVDTAHLRDWCDWTLYLGALIARNSRSGVSVDLPDEGGRRRIVIRPFESERLAQYGVVPLAVPLAQWIAFQLSVWHEIATWYGWSATAFSEEASAFSPEDLYSNLLGIKLAAVLVYQGNVTSEAAYNENMNVALPNLLHALGAVPGDQGRTAMSSIDGIWWDSRRRLPEKALVRRRYMDHGTQLTPWLVSRRWGLDERSRRIAFACNGKEQPIVLQNPEAWAGVPFHDQATVEIEVSPAVAARMPLPESRHRRITQDDFAAIISRIRTENDAEFGAGSCTPDPVPLARDAR